MTARCRGDQRFAVLRDHFGSALLLEAPASSAQVRTLLPTSPHSLVLITSQRPLRGLVADGAHLSRSNPLTPMGRWDSCVSTSVRNLLPRMATRLVNWQSYAADYPSR